MGLSSFPSASEGVLPILVMNTLISVAILKKLARAFLELVGATTWVSSTFDENTISSSEPSTYRRKRVRGISIIKFKSSHFALHGHKPTTTIECCVCLSKFEEEEEVSELSCKHFFHKKCLDKWFDNHHSTCPLCRSIN